jgi:hypothetical protein
MTIPHYINEHQSDIRSVKVGWYAMDNKGKLTSGPFFSYEECFRSIPLHPRRVSQAQGPKVPRPAG